MFKKDIQPGAKTKVKSSVQRGIRAKVLETYPLLEPHIEEILPKKSQIDQTKLPDRVTLYTLPSTPLFWQHMDDPILPHLTLVHKYPHAFHRLRVDRGAIRFVLSGATLMVPGLTSPGGRLPGEAKGGEGDEEGRWGEKDLSEGEIVVIEAEGKESACMVGVLKSGTGEMKKVKKGVAVEGGHYLGDGLWKLHLD
ncbi:translation machinery-associated protein 20 [Viridothelium virens]|uniref:Translation machinery-associated protein 20 n=1 Tax=Viridothelium virens TaxID=1048519 RepID=A0A6A6HA01_VIRVR|nr:translation machinery-associated protein 20 [Viridothelium virens]